MPKFTAIVIGAGSISNAWFPPLIKESVRVVAVVDLKKDAAESQIEKYELKHAVASDDLKKILRDVPADFAVNLTIPEAHGDVTCAALKAGLHVITEKPMAASMADARRMVRQSERAGKRVMVSQSRRWNPKHDAIVRSIAANKIGTLASLDCTFYIGAHFGGFRAEMPSPLILDMAIHHFDLARMISGQDPVAVYAKEFNPPGSWYQGDAAASCIFEMTGGVIFTYSGSWCAEGLSTSWNGDWRIVGDKGAMVYARDSDPVIEVASGKKGLVRGVRSVKPAKSPLKYEGMHGALREMLAFLKTGKTPQTECHDNIKSLAMVFAAMESSRKGRRVAVRF